MGAACKASLVFLAAFLLVAAPPFAEASSRHLHKHLEAAAARQNDFFFTNISQLNPNVTANLAYGCWYKPINFTLYENVVENLVESFYQKLLNGSLLGNGNFTVVRTANGTLSIVNGNVTVSPTGQLVVDGILTGTKVYNGTLRLNQTLGLLPNLTSLVPEAIQQLANATGNNSTLGGILGSLGGILGGGILGGALPSINTSAIQNEIPSINYSPAMLTNTSQLLSYSPVTPNEILAYIRNLTQAALAAVNVASSELGAGSELNRATVTFAPTARPGVVATPAPTTSPLVSPNSTNGTIPGFPAIKVYFYVIVDSSSDNSVTQTMLVNQIAKMNADYSTITPFRFVLAGAVKIVNPDWVGRDLDTEEDVFNEMKSQTRSTASPQDLHIWITDFYDQGLNGYATFPWDYADDPTIDGLVISLYTLPRATNDPNYQDLRSVGITGSHESGHWIGLFHTFQGGCTGSGDYVSDTAPESTPNDYSDPTCKTQKYTCSKSAADPIYNFMDYGACRRQFTTGQVTRMKQYWTYYRYNQG